MPTIKIVKTEDFEQIQESHRRIMNSPEGENEHYKNVTKMLHNPVGHRLMLEIEITDEELSGNVFNLLHGKIEGEELLGFKVIGVGFNHKEHVTEVLDRTITMLEQMKRNI